MLNNGHVSGMGTPDNGQGMYGHPGGEFSPHNPYMNGPAPPSGGNGVMGHHSGGVCSQMGINQNSCPPNARCAGCGGLIMDRWVFSALERFWHHSCLKCTACTANLADVGNSCFTRDGMILCRQDYLKIFGSGGACQGCGQGIPASELVMRAGMSLPGSPPLVFHMKCFKCSKCHNALVPGDRYSVLNGSLFCEQDALKVSKSKLMKNGIGSPSNANSAATNGTTAPRKGKVGRPRRSRD